MRTFCTKAALLAVVLLPTAHAIAQSPQAVLEAGRAANPGYGYKPNVNGVYPVPLRWQTPADTLVLVSGGAVSVQSDAWHVYRSENPTGNFTRISVVPVRAERDKAGIFIFFDENPAAIPGKCYYYRVLPLDSPEEFPDNAKTCMGYGALSHEQYLREYNNTVKSSHQKLTFMHKYAALSKLGKETKNGTISGSVAYHARIAGIGARITIRYERYADFYIEGDYHQPYFLLTGDCNTRASIDQNGTMDGAVLVSGMYPGKIFYDRIVIKKAAAADGTYGVEPEGFPRLELSWKLIN